MNNLDTSTTEIQAETMFEELNSVELNGAARDFRSSSRSNDCWRNHNLVISYIAP